MVNWLIAILAMSLVNLCPRCQECIPSAVIACRRQGLHSQTDLMLQWAWAVEMAVERWRHHLKSTPSSPLDSLLHTLQRQLWSQHLCFMNILWISHVLLPQIDCRESNWRSQKPLQLQHRSCKEKQRSWVCSPGAGMASGAPGSTPSWCSLELG